MCYYMSSQLLPTKNAKILCKYYTNVKILDYKQDFISLSQGTL